MLDQTRLKELLHYDPDTGVWTWLACPRASYTKSEAGWIDVHGYRRIKIDGHTYISSRLAWLYTTGKWPEEMDHINRDPSDDRLDNLRPANRSINNRNRDWGAMQGISRWHNKWKLVIRKMYLGLYEHLEDAQAIRDLALWYGKGERL